MGMCLIGMLSLETIVWLVPVVLKVALGLGMVIFVHELGHFLVAKACGVKCEKFFIGFDIPFGLLINRFFRREGEFTIFGLGIPRTIGWPIKVGETTYGIGIVPLGGYVSMFGQEDDPSQVAEQMQKSQIAEGSRDAVKKIGPDGKEYYIDRRSYQAKSVPQRMAIISAGVIMNVIFAFIFAVIAYGMGVPYIPSVVSEIIPGSPAWKAGIAPGDEIVQINDTVNPTFVQLKGGVTLGDLEHGIQTRVRRAADGKVVDVPLMPQQDNGRLATIGLGGPQSLKLFEMLPVVDNSSAAQAKLVSPSDLKGDDAKLKAGDEIVRVGDVAVKDYRELSAELAKHASDPLQITVRRTESTGDKAASETSRELTFELAPQGERRFDFEMQMGPITSVQNDSPAAKAGLVAGDVIKLVDGRKPGEGTSASEIWTPQTLSNYLSRAAKDGKVVKLTIARAPLNEKPSEVEIDVKPRIPTTFDMAYPARSMGIPMAANEIGIAYRIGDEVASVPAAANKDAELAAGDRIAGVKLIFPKDEKGETPTPLIVKLETDRPSGLAGLIGKILGRNTEPRPEPNWPTVLDAIQFVPEGTEAELTVVRGGEEPHKVSTKPIVAADAFLAARGFLLQPVERIRKAESFSEQVRYGWNETTESLTMVFRFLRKLGTQVPMSALGGPVTIAKAAGYSAAEGLSSLLVFLTMLSANLAVINVLPIPILDGGHLMFLAYEGLRGRPANEKIVIALHTAGFVLIVSMMLYVLGLDLNIIPRNL